MITWDDVTDFYRKRPTRFKAIQYEKGKDLPPYRQQWNHSFRMVEDLLEGGDWVVLEIETNKTFILKDEIFNLVFERVN